MGERRPRPPRWALWAVKRMSAPSDVRTIHADMEELHTLWVERVGHREARRRFLRQWRQYPWRLLADKLRRYSGRAYRKFISQSGHSPLPTFQGVAQSARGLARAPGLTAAIVLTVGVGVGGCTAVFAVVEALFFQPLPYSEPQGLAWIYTDSPPNQWPLSVADFQALKAQQTAFEDVAAYLRQNQTLVTAETAERILVFAATPGFTEMMGLPLLAGRAPADEDGQPGAQPTALVTRGFASRHLGSTRADASDALGSLLDLDGTRVRVIGIVPGVGRNPLARGAEVYPTLRLAPPERKGPFFLTVVGRLASSSTPASARAELEAINSRIFPLWVDSYQDETASWGLEPLSITLRGNSGPLLAVMMGAVAMLLLIATANAASLLLARMSARARELAVRRALGASRGRILSHLLTESGILALGGVGVGLLVAHATIGVLPSIASAYLPRLGEVHLSGSVMAFSVAIAMASGFLFGVLPLFYAGGASDPLQGGGRTVSGGRREHRSQRMLVAAQLAVVVPLLTGAGLLVSSFARLQQVDPGFTAPGLLTVRVAPSPVGYPDAETRAQFWDRVARRLVGRPEVTAVGLASGRPPVENGVTNNFDLEDAPTPPGQSQPSVPWILADPGYFTTMKIPLRAGRMFDEGDRRYEPEVAIVDEAWALRFFPGEDVVGKRFRHGGCTDCAWTTVVGMVGSVPFQGLGTTAGGTVYQPDPARRSSTPFLFIRTDGSPTELATLVREELRAVDPTTPLTALATGDELLEGSLAQPRHLMLVLLVFSSVALALAVVGLYGITAFGVHQRRGDIALRMALGGPPSSVLRVVMRQGLALAAWGIVAGVAASLLLTRAMAGLLYGVKPYDPMILAGVILILFMVSVAACLIPGSRAVRVHPGTVLRQE
ncbi:MAG TPA: ABC transporter permease [Longimicrobiales bacterium]|nr:ABC transporter permease [Longimicrobiales bacterium]